MIRFRKEFLPAGTCVAVLIEDALTRLSKLTKAEFSPKKDCGVFFIAPVLAGKLSFTPCKLKQSESELSRIKNLHF